MTLYFLAQVGTTELSLEDRGRVLKTLATLLMNDAQPIYQEHESPSMTDLHCSFIRKKKR